MSFDSLELPGWVGFLLLIIVGLLMAVHGLADPLGVGLTHTNRVGFATFGLCALAVGLFSWIAGATSKVVGREGKFGVRVKISDLPWWGWLVDVALVVIAIIVFLAAGR